MPKSDAGSHQGNADNHPHHVRDTGFLKQCFFKSATEISVTADSGNSFRVFSKKTFRKVTYTESRSPGLENFCYAVDFFIT